MTNDANTEGRNMAKQQRSTQLPAEIFALTDDLERASGVKFNRQVLAALLQYFFTNANGPDPWWMELAVALEKGEASFADIPLEAARRQSNADRTKYQNAFDELEASGHSNEDATELAPTEAGLVNPLAFRINEWQKLFEESEGEAIDAILSHRRKLREASPFSGRDLDAEREERRRKRNAAKE